MQALTSYQHAHDAAGERTSDRADAVTAAGERIAADPAKLREVIEAMLIETEIDVPELLALLYRANPRIEGTENDRLRVVLRDATFAINDAIDAAAEAEIAQAEAEEERERLNRDWED